MMTDRYYLKVRHLYAPDYQGQRELVVAGGKILAVGADLSALAAALGATPVAHAGIAMPGLIDQHLHYTGGGDGDGPLARMPELAFEAIAAAGVTTSVGLLGSDMEAKNLTQLVRKAHELAARGLTTFVYTGSMALPAPYLTHSVRSDLLLIEKVIGAKTAIAERLYPNLDFPALAGLAGELLLARAMTGKACVLHLHVGRLNSELTMLRRLIDEGGFPPEMALPTHINRAPSVSALFEQGLDFAKSGGNIDFTACLGPRDGLPSGMDAVEAVSRALDAGVPPERLTLSSDAGVAVPDGAGGARAVPPSILFRDVRRLALEAGMGWDAALPLVTTNVARVLGLTGRKGRLAEGSDADLIFLDENTQISHVMANGAFVWRQPT